ncbi:hypothetical protein OnM2_065046 [Erysiphe neolycopersici]|uniref:Uncharacterized protein n=1 Tax=Erysiphe neolycopersici TaxID=212602 RepID=A0A420HMX6_9PEZI|nr:hypothetical protein OnM2_065046 [Erysiphe neolycopersici]
MSLPFPERFSNLSESVDKIKWGKKFNLDDPTDLTEKVVNGYILHSSIWYEDGNYEDYELWEAFREDFEGWSTEVFLIADTKIRRVFRNFLLQHGVYMPRNGQKIADALASVVNDKNYHEWTIEEVQEYMKTTKNFYSRFNPERSLPPTGPSSQRLQNPIILRPKQIFPS